MDSKGSTKKILFVLSRYGFEVNGGMEVHARMIAESLANDFKQDVTVLTTKALDHNTYDNYFENETENINGVKVIRKEVEKIRKGKIQYAYLPSILLRLALFHKFFEKHWINNEGPYSTSLETWYIRHKDEYDSVVFFKYFSWTTYRCIRYPHQNKILVPLVHDDPIIRLRVGGEVLNYADHILWNSQTSRQIAEKHHLIECESQEIVGIWPTNRNVDNLNKEKLLKKYGLLGLDYILFVGRIESGKGADILFDYFQKFKKNHPMDALKLVLVGRENMEIPKHVDIVHLGFLDDVERDSFMQFAKAMVIPSKFESLSMVLLESLNMNVPCIVNGNTGVLAEHAEKSNGVFAFKTYDEFEYAITSFVYEDHKKNYAKYVRDNYSKILIMRKWEKVIVT